MALIDQGANQLEAEGKWEKDKKKIMGNHVKKKIMWKHICIWNNINSCETILNNVKQVNKVSEKAKGVKGID